MVSCEIQILSWVLFAVLATILVVLVSAWLYVQYVENTLISQFNAHLSQYCITLPPLTYREAVYIPIENGVYEQRLSIALLDVSFNTSNANCNNIIPIPDPPGFTNQMQIDGIDPVSGETHLYAFIFWNRLTCQAIFSFTGTELISEWQSDFLFQQVAPTALNGYENGVLVHQGFYEIYLAIRNSLWDWWNSHSSWVKTLYITGHSLGGALSTIAAYDFAEVFIDNNRACNSQTGPPEVFKIPIHYSFAAPRSGNVDYAQIFAERVPTSLRINNTEDLVPQLPLAETQAPNSNQAYTYEQTTGNVPFTVSLGSLAANHTTAYEDYMPVCPEVPGCNID